MTVTLFCLLLVQSAHAIAPAELAAAWEDTAAVRARHAKIGVALDEGDPKKLAEGGLVRRRTHTPTGGAALGAIFIEAPPEQVWVAIQDPGDRPLAKDEAPLVRLPGSNPVRRLNYQRYSLPWPLANRQAVLAVAANEPLWTASEGRVWERNVTLDDPALAPDPDPEGIWLPRVEGGYLMIAAGTGTLVMLQVSVDPGGRLPEELLNRWAVGTLGKTLRKLAGFAVEVPGHYQPGHPVVVRPDGSALSPGTLR